MIVRLYIVPRSLALMPFTCIDYIDTDLIQHNKVKSTISDLGYGDFSEFMIGHCSSTYYRRTVDEKAALFRKIEPYLTFLDYQQLERRGADISAQLQEKDKQIEILAKKQDKFEQIIQSLIDSGQLKPGKTDLST